MSVLVEQNNLHLVGNVDGFSGSGGIVDQYAIMPFLSALDMLEACHKEINIHISGRDASCSVECLVDALKACKAQVNIYVQNSEKYGGYNGVDGKMLEFLSMEARVVFSQMEYNPPFDHAIPEVNIVREMDRYYAYGVENEEEEDYEDEE